MDFAFLLSSLNFYRANTLLIFLGYMKHSRKNIFCGLNKLGKAVANIFFLNFNWDFIHNYTFVKKMRFLRHFGHLCDFFNTVDV